MSGARFKIGDKTYTSAALDRLTLKDILVFQDECEALGHPVKWSQVQQWNAELERLVQAGDEQGIIDHPETLWVMATVIWCSRRVAGEAASFADAIDFPLGDLVWLPATEDRKAPANPRKARPGSGRAAAAKPSRKGSTARTSTPPSIDAS